MRRLLTVLVLLAWPVGLAAAVGEEPKPQEGARWVFTTLPGADLWFHGMALVDPNGPGPNPLYDLGYPRRVREAKEAAGIYPTPLDREAGRLREAFRQDPALEVFHFLPLYFAGAGRVEMMEALKRLATQPSGIPSSPTPQTAFGLSAVGSVLTRPEERVLLGEFVALLESEWNTYLADHLREEAGRRESLLRAVQATWDDDFQPALKTFLAGTELAGGMVALSPALGAEGRVFSGAPEGWRDNIVVVRTLPGAAAVEGEIYLLLREISFSPARRAFAMTGGERDRFEEEASVARGAIRAGALLLEATLPEAAQGFKEFFLEQGGFNAHGAGVDRAFLDAFPLEPGFQEALREMIDATNKTGDSF